MVKLILSRDRPQDQDKILWIEQAFHPHHGSGCKESEFYSLPFGQAVANMY